MSGERWRTADSELVWRQWPDELEVVVFSPRSGDVHVLAQSARLLLEELSIHPLTTEEIGAFLVEKAGVDPSGVGQLLPDVMASLHEAELVERL